ncbi:MAG TPA: hypothetical protein VGE76_08150 [Opitutaceae bacterium]
MFRAPATTALLAAISLLLCGCGTAAKTERSESIRAKGDASIEGVRTVGITVTDLIVLKIDGQFFVKKDKKGVYELTPGPHEIEIHCSFGRPPIAGVVIDAGNVALKLEARAGTRYRVAARKLSEKEADVWIENVATGQPATTVARISLQGTRQEMPAVPIIIPAGR